MRRFNYINHLEVPDHSLTFTGWSAQEWNIGTTVVSITETVRGRTVRYEVPEAFARKLWSTLRAAGYDRRDEPIEVKSQTQE